MQIIEIVYSSVESIALQLGAWLPKFFGAFILFLIGWLLAKVLATVIRRVLITLNAKWIDERLKSVELFRNLNIQVAELVASLVYWLILLITLTSAAEVIQLTALSQGINNFIAYLPQLFSAALFFVVGSFVANLIKNVTEAAFLSMGLMSGRLISGFIYYFVLVLVCITALNQAGIDTELITQNLSIIVAAIFFAFAIGYGIASKDIMANLLASFYSREKFNIGQRIRIEDIEGVIIKMDNTSVVLNSGDREVVIPLQKLLTSTVEIW